MRVNAEDRELRSHVGRVLLLGMVLAPVVTAACGVGGALHPNKVDAAGAVMNGLGGGALLTALLAASYLWERRTSWRVGPGGVTVCRGGRPARALPWSEVQAVRVLPFGAALVTAGRPRQEWLRWPGPADARWLRGYAADRLWPGTPNRSRCV